MILSTSLSADIFNKSASMSYPYTFSYSLWIRLKFSDYGFYHCFHINQHNYIEIYTGFGISRINIGDWFYLYGNSCNLLNYNNNNSKLSQFSQNYTRANWFHFSLNLYIEASLVTATFIINNSLKLSYTFTNSTNRNNLNQTSFITPFVADIYKIFINLTKSNGDDQYFYLE